MRTVKDVCKELAEIENHIQKHRYTLPDKCYRKLNKMTTKLSQELYIRAMNESGYILEIDGYWKEK